MSRKWYGRGPWRRALSMLLVIAFTLSFTGIGFASPQAVEAPTNQASGQGEEPTADTTPPQAEPAPEPAPVEPAPEAEPLPVEEPAGDSAPIEAPAQDQKASRGGAGGSDNTESKETVEPVSDPAPGQEPVAVAPSVGIAAVTAQAVTVGLDGWRTTPSPGWVSGDLGKDWAEDDWVPYRFFFDNTKSVTTFTAGAFDLIYDHYNPNKNTIGVDETRYWKVLYADALPSTYGPWGSDLPPAAGDQDQPFDTGSFGTSPYLKTHFAAGRVVIPPGKFGIVYYQAHLALTSDWLPKLGASGYTGSSMHMRVESPSGDKSVPIPVPPAGFIEGVKFNDLDKDGVRDAGEPGLGGWVFHLTGGNLGGGELTTTSAGDGSFTFWPLAMGTYALTETSQTGWYNTTPLPMAVVIDDERGVGVEVGNALADVTKSWELSIDNVPIGATFFVRYSVNGVQKPDKALTLDNGVYKASDANIPYGASVVTSYYASYAGENLYLGSDGPEVLTANFTNYFSWDSRVSGHKFGDTDADGIWDAGESGLTSWTITLYRVGVGGTVTYATQLTGAGGNYAFTDVLPGTYYVQETQKTGWYKTVGDEANFVVSAADPTEADLDFGNILADGSIDIEKTGASLAHEGDTITYHFVVTNNGTAPLFNVVVSDPLLGGTLRVYTKLSSGETTSFDENYTIPNPAGDVIQAVDNTVTVLGQNLLGEDKSDADTWHVGVIHPHIAIAKTVDFDGDGVFHDSEQGYEGDTAVWKLVVSNSGDTTLSSVVVTDTNGASYGPYSLNAGASQVITYTEVISADKTNNARARGIDVLQLAVNAGPDPASVDVIDPGITVVKTVDLNGDGVFHDSETGYLGDTAVWKIVVTNSGDVDLSSVVVTDSNGGSWNVGTLASLASWSTTYATSPTGDVLNTAYTRGNDPLGKAWTDSDPADIDLIAPALSIAKTVDFNGDGVFSESEKYYAGATAVWKLLVTNTGDVALTDVYVTDTNGSNYGPYSLAVGASQVVTYTEVINADKTNNASATGLDPQENEVDAGPDAASVDAIDPDIEIAKTVDFNGDGVFHDSETYYAGEDAVWKIVVTNSGDVTLTAVTITDSNGHTFPAPFTLGPGASTEITYTTNPLTDTENWASVAAKDPLNGDVGARDNASVDTISTGMTVAKTVDFNGDGTYSEHETWYIGEDASWKITVTNTSDVTLTAVTLTDPVLGSGAFWPTLGPGETTSAIIVVAANADTTNTGFVSAIDPLGATINRQDDASVDVIDPGVGVVKTVDYDGDGVYHEYEDGLLGATAHWKIVVSNEGDVALTGVTVTDSNGQSFGPISLAVGGSQEFTYDTVPTGYTLNTATAYGTDPLGTEFGPATDSAEVQPWDPSISLVKTAMPTTILSGDMVTYNYLVTNTSEDTWLFDIDVTDAPLGYIGHIDSLAPLANTLVSTTVPIAVDTHNVGTATGFYAFGNEPESAEDYDGSVTATDDADVDVVHPALSIAKTVEFNGDGTYGEDETALSGSQAKWRIIVTNSGDVPLTSVVVTDTNGQSFGPVNLAVGASAQFDYNTNPTANTVNTAYATGWYTAPGTQETPIPRKVGPVSDSAQVRVFLPFFPPDLTILKSADHTDVAPGDTVVYTLTYSNIGTGAATDFVIVDDFDERYVTITDAGGGTVAGGKITWNLAGPLYKGESGTISYTVRINDVLPAGTTNIDNVVVITHPDDPDPSNNTDDWRVVAAFLPFTEPFLPFTGGEVWVLLYIGVALAAMGALFRRLGRQEA